MASTPLDSQGNPIPVAPGISPDKTALSGGNASLITNAGGPNMTPPPAAQAPAAPTQDSSTPAQQQSLFSKIGGFLQQHGDVINDIANHLSAAAGNYAPLEMAHQQAQLKLQQQNAELQRQLQQSTLVTQGQQQQKNAFDLAHQRTPEQISQANLDYQKQLEEQKNTLGAPKDIVAPSQSGQGMAHYNQTFNPATNQWETKPTMAQGANGPQPLLATPKAAGAWETVPDGGSLTGYSQRLTDMMGNEIGRRTGAIPPNALVGSTTSGTHQTIQHDANGNPIVVTENTQSTKTPNLGGGAGAGQGTPQPGGAGAGGGNRAKPLIGPDGNPVAGKPSADEQRRSDLVENMNENLDKLEDIVKRRPELFGAPSLTGPNGPSLGGRGTQLKQFFGTDDPDVASLKAIREYFGMASVGAHAMRNAQHIATAADAVVSGFNNGPGALLGPRGAIQTARDSAKTFSNDTRNNRPIPQTRPQIPMAQPTGNGPAAPQSQAAPQTMPTTGGFQTAAQWKAAQAQQQQPH